MLILAGLGNPGGRYAKTRHNVGFMVLDAIFEAYGFPAWQNKFNAHVSLGLLSGRKVVLCKPLCFMNNSGQAVGELMRFYKGASADVIVCYDELDLEGGRVRVKNSGGHAGHNGVRSVMAHIGADFRRVRIGIGHPGERGAVNDWVLSDFSSSERVWLGGLIERIAGNIGLLVEDKQADFLEAARLSV